MKVVARGQITLVEIDSMEFYRLAPSRAVVNASLDTSDIFIYVIHQKGSTPNILKNDTEELTIICKCYVAAKPDPVDTLNLHVGGQITLADIRKQGWNRIELILQRQQGVTVKEIDTASIAIVKDGTPGKDGEASYTLTLDPARVVLNTDENGIVSNADIGSVNVAVIVMKGTEILPLASVNPLFTCFGCSAKKSITVLGSTKYNSIQLTAINTERTADFIYTKPYSYIDLTVYAGPVLLRGRIEIAVNIQAQLMKYKADNKGIHQSISELSGGVNNLTRRVGELDITAKQVAARVNQIDTEGKKRFGELSVKTDSIAAKVGERYEHRNLLIGSAFRNTDEIRWNSPAYPCRISKNVQYEETNSVLIDCASSTAIYKGVRWDDVKVAPGKKYHLSFYAQKKAGKGIDHACCEIYAYKANNAQAATFRPVVGDIVLTQDGVWKRFDFDFTAASDVDHISLSIWVEKSGTMYMARPMLEQAESYRGWTLSAYDFDYTGGNLLDNARTLALGGNLNTLNGEVTTNNLLEISSIYAAAYSGYTEVLQWSIAHKPDTDYIISFLAKGQGNFYLYFYNGTDVTEFTEDSEGSCRTQSDGFTIFTLSGDWRKYWVRWHTQSSQARNTANILFRVVAGNSVNISRPKLEIGATVTEFTESKDDKVSKKALLDTGIDILRRLIMLTTDNFYIRNNSGVPTLALDQNGKLKTEFVQAQKVSAWNIAQPFEEYADITALRKGNSLSWNVKAPGNYGTLLTGEWTDSEGVVHSMNGTVLNIFNSSAGTVSILLPIVGADRTKTIMVSTSTVVIPKWTMFSARGVKVTTNTGDQVIAFYLLVPFIQAGSSITITNSASK